MLATGFDAMTGSVGKLNIVGRSGETLNAAWASGPVTYLGLGVPGFPNVFNISGPGSPSVLANMALHSELHVDWIADAIGYLGAHGAIALEATRSAAADWTDECTHRAAEGLMLRANSWYLGRERCRQAAGVHAVCRRFRRLRSDYRGHRRGRI